MKQVYKCEFCDEISKNKIKIQEHEKICGYNPKNKIDNEIVLKISRLYEHVEESLIYILLSEYGKKIDFYIDEFDRATKTNCPASIYENKDELCSILSRAKRIERESDFKWFMEITKRDNPELIQAIKTYLKEPEFRV